MAEKKTQARQRACVNPPWYGARTRRCQRLILQQRVLTDGDRHGAFTASGDAASSCDAAAVRAPRRRRGRRSTSVSTAIEVVEHRAMGRHLVAPPDRLEDAPVVLVGARGPAGRVQRLLAALGEQIHERVDDARDGAIVGAGGDGGVERARPGPSRCGPPRPPWPAPRGCAPSPRSPRGVARRAARAAMAGSSRRRASKSSPTASRCGRMTRASGSISVSTETSRTKVPSPARISISPRLCSARRASRTEVRLTMNFSARSRSGGSRSPDLSRPSAISCLTWRTISS